ncbi:MAG: hypothetical protein LQ338_005527 [Usnochroma carphineum]|nr:MAG: hypothetical protein LQ338_005527 [Usnochroma carphineum]
MPASTTSEPMGHRHTESNASKRHALGPWSHHDDEQLKRARAQGLNWTAIAETYFPTKTPNACRKRHERLIEKINANGIWNALKFEEVAKAYLDVREEMWKMVAERVNEKWTVVESKCMERGVKTLATLGRAASRKDRSPQNHEVDYDINRDDGLVVDTHSENEAVEEQHPFSASAFSPSSRRTTLSNVSSASFTSPLPRPTPTLPNINQSFPTTRHPYSSTSLPGISSIVGPNNLPVTTH